MTDGYVLVVDDDALIAMDIEMTLEARGYRSIRICNSVASATAAVEAAVPIAAVLDMNLGQDETSIPVAQRLRALGCPFIFLTGYTAATVPVPEELADAPRLIKPFREADLVAAVRAMGEGVE